MCCAFFYNFSNPVDYGDADSSFEAMEEGEEEGVEEGEEGMEVDCTPLDATFVVGVGDKLANQGVTTGLTRGVQVGLTRGVTTPSGHKHYLNVI